MSTLKLPEVGIKPPKIPVHMNLRVTMRPLNKMTGDSLPLLTKVQASESNPRVRGRNANVGAKHHSNLERLYQGHALLIDRIHRDQVSLYSHLVRLHQDRRRIARSKLDLRQDLLQQDRKRETQRLIAESEMEALNRQIQNANLALKHKVEPTEESKEESKEDEVVEKSTTEVSNSVQNSNNQVVTLPKLASLPEIAEGKVEESTRTIILREVKVIEPSKLGNELTTTRQQTSEIKLALNPLRDDSAERNTINTQDSIEIVTDANRTIAGTVMTSAGKMNPVDESKPVEELILQNVVEQAGGSNSKEEKLGPTRSTKVEKPTRTLAQQNQDRLKQREHELKLILDEPYQAYTRTAGGDIVPLKNLPPRFHTEEPSNKQAYWCKRILKSQRRDYLQKIHDNDKFTASSILSGSHKSQKGTLSKRKFGRISPASLLFKSLLPPEISPGSEEAHTYTGYVLKYGPTLGREMWELPLDYWEDKIDQ